MKVLWESSFPRTIESGDEDNFFHYLFVKLTKVRNYRALRCHNKLFLSREKTIAPYSATSLFVSDVFLACKLMHDLFEIEMTPIEEQINNRRWYSEMSRISPIPHSVSILYIYYSYIPILLSLTILIYSPLHPNEVVGIWFFYTSVDCSILSSCTELL